VKDKQRISTAGGDDLKTDNPFAALNSSGFKTAPSQPAPLVVKKRGRLELRREKAGRGGKTVTTVRGEGFLHINPQQLDDYLKRLKTTLGVGGARNNKQIELQGDCRDAVEAFLLKEGFRVVRAGG